MPSPDLFGSVSSFPPGFRYQPELISDAEERRLLHEMEKLHFKPFEFQGFTGKRLIVSFGWRYDFNGGGLQKTEDMPDFLLGVRKAAAQFANMEPSRLQHVLLTQYPPGAAIGWHKDRSVFGAGGRDFVAVCVHVPISKAGRTKMGTKFPYC